MWLEVHESNKYYLVVSSGCVQTFLDMPQVMTDSESALSQEQVKLWGYFFACVNESVYLKKCIQLLQVGVIRCV